MIVIVTFLTGAVAGFLLARRRGGKLLDELQYASAFAIAGGIIGLFLVLLAHWML
jgi:hypothetical protein